eukprot:GHVP01041640.1.p1 GENE.GHVP01041640.1~~GHVP01041640.1.p1  ORF type:complete len:627 (+),score=95.06 GHVP01041640.1:38-1918(+)
MITKIFLIFIFFLSKIISQYLPDITDIYVGLTFTGEVGKKCDEARDITLSHNEIFGLGTYESPFLLQDEGRTASQQGSYYLELRKACFMLLRLRKKNSFSQFYYGKIFTFQIYPKYEECSIILQVEICAKICEMPCISGELPPCDIELDSGFPPALEATSILERIDNFLSTCTDIPQHPDLNPSASIPISGHLLYEIKWRPTNKPLSECGDIVELWREGNFGQKVLRFVVISALERPVDLSVGNSLSIPAEICTQLCGAVNCAENSVKQECRILGRKIDQTPLPHQANKISHTYSESSLDLVTPCFNVINTNFIEILATNSIEGQPGYSNQECANVYMFRKKHTEDRFLYGMVSKYIYTHDAVNIVALGINQETCGVICSAKCEIRIEIPCEIEAFPAEIKEYVVIKSYSSPNPNNCLDGEKPLPQFTMSGIAVDTPDSIKSQISSLQCEDIIKIRSISQTWYIRIDSSYSNISKFVMVPNKFCYEFCKDGCFDDGSLSCFLEATKINVVDTADPKISKIQDTYENIWDKMDPCLIPAEKEGSGNFGDFAFAGAFFTNSSTSMDHLPQSECGNIYMFRLKNSTTNFVYVKVVGFSNFPPGNGKPKPKSNFLRNLFGRAPFSLQEVL